MNSIDDILKMAQNVQAELEKAQASLDGIEVEGASGGGLVKVRASAKGRIIGVEKSRCWKISSPLRSTMQGPRPMLFHLKKWAR
jgi:ribosomal protein S3